MFHQREDKMTSIMATKVWADTLAQAEASLAGSRKRLKTDWFDILYFHHLGDRKVDVARNPDGVFTWLLKYALGLPGVATANLGVHTIEQFRQNLEIVRRFQPLTAEEQEPLASAGRKLAKEWGPHFGPVT